MKKINFSRPSDSFFTHIFARSVSVHLTPVVAKTSITPLQVTILGLIIGLFAACIGSVSGWAYGILAAILIELSHILDCVDGELARLTGKGNPFAASLDPISDRIKDTAVIIAAFIQGTLVSPFGLSDSTIAFVALITMGLWLCYMYIVDAFLNPARRKLLPSITNKRIYIGLYDLFVYGSIFFWLTNQFEYFLFFVLVLASFGVVIQILRLKKILMLDQVPFNREK
ncbi:MAG: CDP-alcohol phosphatidyltransferase family protein [Desulfobacteraceae bacterium]|nr:CDP-alcohol phosphatidyltransferase family protein [Desulfobacteraceae bacterium]MBU4055415.1 CDP-alcohol phosphatidyltransferase family protein [Pseudomonadota bacterium]